MNNENKNVMPALVRGAIARTISTLGIDHFKRPRGSYVEQLRGVDEEGIRTVDMLKNCSDWESFTPPDAQPQCRYFKAKLPPGFVGVVAAQRLDELPKDMLKRVRVRMGHHGNPELVCPAIKSALVMYVTVIVGVDAASKEGDGKTPGESNSLVYTWFPGEAIPVDGPLGSHAVKFVDDDDEEGLDVDA